MAYHPFRRRGWYWVIRRSDDIIELRSGPFPSKTVAIRRRYGRREPSGQEVIFLRAHDLEQYEIRDERPKERADVTV